MNNHKLIRQRKAFLAQQRLQKQWDQLLSNQGFSMNRGLSDKLSYVGIESDLVVLEKIQKGKSTD